MKEYSHIRRAVFNQPWAIVPEQLEVIAGILERGLPDMASGKITFQPRDPAKLRYTSGIPIIPIDGPISKKMNLFSDVSGGTSIDQLNSQFDEALASDSPTIIFAIDSPGGAIPGVPEFATKVFQAARTGGKTIVASIESLGASAAYWIAAQSDEVHATEGSEIGSVGVVAQILDNTRQMKNEGVDPEWVRSSELKAPGVGPMTPNQRRSVEEQVTRYADMFKAALSRSRPRMDARASNGAVFGARDALAMGMIDSIATLDQIVAKYARS